MQLAQDIITAGPQPTRTTPRQPEVVKSAVRVIEVLEFFDRIRAPAPVGQISAALQFPQSSTSALLRSLTKIGYLRYDSRARTYFPTERVPLLGNSVARPWFRGGPLLDLMDDLAERAQLVVALARRNGDHVQYVHLASPRDSAPAEVATGAVVPLATSAAGLILLAQQTDEEIRRLMHRLNAEARAPTDIVRIPNLMQRIADIRQRGHVYVANRDCSMLALRLPGEPQSPALILTLFGGQTTVANSVPAMLSLMRAAIVKWLKPSRLPLMDFAVPAEFALSPSKASAVRP